MNVSDTLINWSHVAMTSDRIFCVEKEEARELYL